MGESQVLILKDVTTNTIYYSGVIDCYSHNSINKTWDILDENKVRNLDFLCWTHPDDDHSIGLNDIVATYCDHNTKIVLPEGVYGQPHDFVTYNPEILLFFSNIANNNQNQNYNVNTATVMDGQTQGVETVVFTHGIKQINFQIDALAPSSAIIRRRNQFGLKKKNDISIALLITMGEFTFFLTGDIENQTINLIAEYNLAKLTYLKTPHHTSYSSDKLLSVFERVFGGHKIPYTCTTAYRKHSLPDVNLIKEYRPYTDSFFTTHDDLSTESFGVIRIEFNPFDNSAIETLFGSANKIY